jgi:hypothetical protein
MWANKQMTFPYDRKSVQIRQKLLELNSNQLYISHTPKEQSRIQKFKLRYSIILAEIKCADAFDSTLNMASVIRSYEERHPLTHNPFKSSKPIALWSSDLLQFVQRRIDIIYDTCRDMYVYEHHIQEIMNYIRGVLHRVGTYGSYDSREAVVVGDFTMDWTFFEFHLFCVILDKNRFALATTVDWMLIYKKRKRSKGKRCIEKVRRRTRGLTDVVNTTSTLAASLVPMGWWSLTKQFAVENTSISRFLVDSKPNRISPKFSDIVWSNMKGFEYVTEGDNMVNVSIHEKFIIDRMVWVCRKVLLNARFGRFFVAIAENEMFIKDILNGETRLTQMGARVSYFLDQIINTREDELLKVKSYVSVLIILRIRAYFEVLSVTINNSAKEQDTVKPDASKIKEFLENLRKSRDAFHENLRKSKDSYHEYKEEHLSDITSDQIVDIITKKLNEMEKGVTYELLQDILNEFVSKELILMDILNDDDMKQDTTNLWIDYMQMIVSVATDSAWYTFYTIGLVALMTMSPIMMSGMSGVTVCCRNRHVRNVARRSTQMHTDIIKHKDSGQSVDEMLDSVCKKTVANIQKKAIAMRKNGQVTWGHIKVIGLGNYKQDGIRRDPLLQSNVTLILDDYRSSISNPFGVRSDFESKLVGKITRQPNGKPIDDIKLRYLVEFQKFFVSELNNMKEAYRLIPS